MRRALLAFFSVAQLLACGSNDDGVLFQGAGGQAGKGGAPSGTAGASPTGGGAGVGASGGGATAKGGSGGKGGAAGMTSGKGGAAGTTSGKGGSAGKTTGEAGQAGTTSGEGGEGGEAGTSGVAGTTAAGGNSGDAGASAQAGFGGEGGQDAAGAGGGAGSNDPGSCVPGQQVPCYSGPAGTSGVGACKAGMAICSPEGVVGACVGEVLPALDACDGIDRDCDGKWVAKVPAACATIQAAIDAVDAANIQADVLVAAGVYKENIDFKGVRARIFGEGGRAATTIEGTGDGPVVRMDSNETNDSVLTGFTIRGGHGAKVGDAVHGGGIYVKGGAPRLIALDVRDNHVDDDSGYGGGVALFSTSASLDDVRIYDNSSNYYGGGLHISQGAPRLHRIVLTDNEAVWGGGASIYYSKAVLTRVSFARNDAARAGAVFLQGGSPSLQNVAMVEDFGDEDGAVRISDGCTGVLRNATIGSGDGDDVAILVDKSPAVSLSFVNLWVDGKTLSVVGASAPPAVLRVDPQFVSQAGAAVAWNLRLGAGSKLIDAGDPGVLDEDGSRSDIGAFGGPALP